MDQTTKISTVIIIQIFQKSLFSKYSNEKLINLFFFSQLLAKIDRKKLIEGSRGILQGTSSLLLCFDESEVRKIIRECKRVLDYLAVAEVIDTMEDLVHFLKNLSPCLSKVSREVGAREKELTHQVHREILVRCLDQVIREKIIYNEIYNYSYFFFRLFFCL